MIRLSEMISLANLANKLSDALDDLAVASQLVFVVRDDLSSERAEVLSRAGYSVIYSDVTYYVLENPRTDIKGFPVCFLEQGQYSKVPLLPVQDNVDSWTYTMDKKSMYVYCFEILNSFSLENRQSWDYFFDSLGLRLYRYGYAVRLCTNHIDESQVEIDRLALSREVRKSLLVTPFFRDCFESPKAVSFIFSNGKKFWSWFHVVFKFRETMMPHTHKLYDCEYLLGNRKFTLNSFVAQSEDESEQEDGLGEGYFSMVLKFLQDKLSDFFTKVRGTVQNSLNKVWETLKDFFGSILGGFGDKLEAIKDGLKNILKNFFLDLIHWKEITETLSLKSQEFFNGVEELKTRARSTVNKGAAMAKIILLFILATLTGIGLFRSSAFSRFICSEEDGELGNESLPENPTNAALAVGKKISSIFGFKGFLSAGINEHIKMLSGLMSEGTVFASVVTIFFVFFPPVIRKCLYYWLGDAQSRLRVDVTDWKCHACTVLAYSKTSQAIKLDFFKESLESCKLKGEELLNRACDLSDSHSRTIVSTLQQKILSIDMKIKSVEFNSNTRDLPFCMHLFGQPGIVKSLIGRPLLAAVCNYRKNDIYDKNAKEVFWSAYNGQKGVIIDEFLALSKETNERIAEDYLMMNSSAEFRLEMPTLDDPSVGIKGTTFSSETILTISNNAYFTVDSLNNEALNRRRNVVIHAEYHPSFHNNVNYGTKDTEGNFYIDLKKLSREQIRNLSWIRFRYVTKYKCDKWRKSRSAALTFDELKVDLRSRIAEHRETCETIRNLISDPDDLTTESPEVCMKRELLKQMGFSLKPPSLSSVFMNFGSQLTNLMTSFVAQGSGTLHRHTCEKCDYKWTHEGFVSECPMCGDQNPCAEGSFPPDTTCSIYGCTDEPTSYMENEEEKSSTLCKFHRSPQFKELNRDPGLFNYGEFSECDSTVRSLEEKMQISLHNVNRDPWEAWDLLPSIPRLPEKIPVMKSCIAVIALCSAFGMIKTVLFSRKKEKPVQLSYTAQTGSVSRSRPIKNGRFSKTRFSRPIDMEPQASSLNVCDLVVGNEPLKCIPIKGKWVMTYFHGFLERDGSLKVEGTPMRLENKGVVYEWELSREHILMECMSAPFHSDILFFEVQDKKYPMAKDVTHLFVSEEEFPMDSRFRVQLRTTKGVQLTDGVVDSKVYSYRTQRFELEQGVLYNADTYAGDCGTPVHFSSGRLINKCLGFHVAGSTSSMLRFGFAQIVTKELLIFALSDKDFVAQGVYEDVRDLNLPNLREVTELPPNAQHFISNASKLKESEIAPFLPLSTTRQPAVLSDRDPRSQGADPLSKAVIKLGNSVEGDFNHSLLPLVEEDMVKFLKENLDFSSTEGLRMLTFEEACFGVEGKISGLVTKTNAGFPLAHITNKPGKTEFIWHDEAGNPHFCPEFKKRCLDMLDMFLSGQTYEKVFLGFMKDELRPLHKIKDLNTRIIFSNDLHFNVVCRMVFGSLVAALNNSFPKTNYAIGINPVSHDMELVYNKLSPWQNRIIEGDYSSFDFHHQKPIMDMVFRVFFRCNPIVPKEVMENLKMVEIDSERWIGNCSFKTKCSNPSGGFWTTPLNCGSNEAYVRMCFKDRFPHLIFEEHVRTVNLGDDVLIAISPNVNWTPRLVGEDMKKLGQVFTPTSKDEELSDNLFEFKQITFLGSHAVQVDGLWSGALRKMSIEDILCWTRNHDLTKEAECKQALEFASQWDEDYYNYILNMVVVALRTVGRDPPSLPPYKSLRSTVASRTAQNGGEFVFVGQSGEISNVGTPDSVSTEGIMQPLNMVNPLPAVGEESSTIGDSSWIHRGTVSWKSQTITGEKIQDVGVPTGLLKMGKADNNQNRRFQDFQYSRPDISIRVSTSSNSFVKGELIVYWKPLRAGDVDLSSCTMLRHVFLNCSTSTTVTLTIPYQFWSEYYDNELGQLSKNPIEFGQLVIRVNDQLSGATEIPVNIHSHIQPGVRIPRSFPDASSANYGITRVNGYVAEHTNHPGNKRLIEFLKTEMVGQGNAFSNNYNISGVAGNVPVGTTSSNAANFSMGGDIPLDNPPLASGSIPVFVQHSGMCKSVGIEPTVVMGLHPGQLYRKGLDLVDPESLSIPDLLSQKCLLDVVTYDVNDLSDANLGDGFWMTSNFGKLEDIPFNIYLLNLFVYWKADLEFSVRIPRTKFHAGSLAFVYNYSWRTLPDDDTGFTSIIDLSEDTEEWVFSVPYDHMNDYLETITSSSVINRNNIMGIAHFKVVNALKTLNDVPTSLNLNCYIRFLNAKVAVVRTPFAVSNAKPIARSGDIGRKLTYTGISGSSSDEDTPQMRQLASKEEFEGQSGDVTDDSSVMPVSQEASDAPGVIKIGEKFEYTVASVIDLCRSYSRTRHHSSFPYKNVWWPEGAQDATVHGIPVTPFFPLAHAYQGWTGTLKYRIFLSGVQDGFTPFVVKTQGLPGKEDIMRAVPGSEGSERNDIDYHGSVEYFPSGASTMLDISVPFGASEMIRPTRSNVDDLGLSYINGTIYVITSPNSRMDLYQSGGDDFRFHFFCPDGQFWYWGWSSGLEN